MFHPLPSGSSTGYMTGPLLWKASQVLPLNGGDADAGDTRQLNAQRNIATGEMSLWTSLTI